MRLLILACYLETATLGWFGFPLEAVIATIVTLALLRAARGHTAASGARPVARYHPKP